MKMLSKKKKLGMVVMAVCLIASLCAGCQTAAKSSGEYYMNSSYSETMKDLNGNDHIFEEEDENKIVNEHAGVAIEYSDTMQKMVEEQSLFLSEMDNMGYLLVYVPKTGSDAILSESDVSDENTEDTSGILSDETSENASGILSDETSEDESANEYISSESSENVDSSVYYYMAVYSVPDTTDEEIEANLNMIKESFNTIKEIGKTDGLTYYLATNTDTSNLDFSDEDQKNIEELASDLENINNNICIFQVDTDSSENIGNFEATSSTGEEVTKDIFSQYDITMINIWSTNCEPCKEEMPELEELSKELPENVNFLSLCIDGADDTELTQSILDDLGCSFRVLYPGSDLLSYIQDNYQFVPTTLFVDKDGNIIGSAITGVPSGDDVVQSYLDAIQTRLDSVNQ